MTQQEILNDIKIIIEGQRARDFQIKPSGMRIPFSNEVVPLLITLSLKLKTEEERSFFWGILQTPLEKEFQVDWDGLYSQDEQVRVTQLVLSEIDKIFTLFIKANRINIALNYFDCERNIDELFISALSALRDLLFQEPHYFNRNILERLDKSISRISRQIEAEEYYEENKLSKRTIIAVNDKRLDVPIQAAPPNKPRPNYISANNDDKRRCELLSLELIKKIREVKFDILKVEYQEINKEINQDRVVLQDRILKFNFDKGLNDSLNKIEEKLLEAKDKFDFKGCVDLTRAFLEELCVSISRRIQQEKLFPFTLDPVHKMNSALGYLKSAKVKFLTEKEDAFISKLYGFFSDVSVHVLYSEKECARISRNFGIELGLYLVEKFEKYLLLRF
jgi:hypothetical protein